MSSSNRIVEVHKYLDGQALQNDGSRSSLSGLEICLSEDSILGCALTTLMDLVVLKLGAMAALVHFTDGDSSYILAESCTDASTTDTGCLGQSNSARQKWKSIFIDSASANAEDSCFILPDLHSIMEFEQPMRPNSLIAMPVISPLGIVLGSIIVLESNHTTKSASCQAEFLRQMAKKCMQQLSLSREAILRSRNNQLDHGLIAFIQSQSTRTQMLEESRTLKEGHPAQDLVIDSCDSTPESTTVAGPQNINPELDLPSRKIAQSKDYKKSKVNPEETTYRGIFRRAAEHLHSALGVDGVAFVDGFSGFHGELLPTAEAQQELEIELAQRPGRKLLPDDFEAEKDSKNIAQKVANQSGPQALFLKKGAGSTTIQRVFTSVNFQKHVSKQRPAEILGLALNSEEKSMRTTPLTATSAGLTGIDEGLLPVLIELYEKGRIWYFDDEGHAYYFDNDRLIDDSNNQDAISIAKSFPGVKQMMFAPLTDVVTLKRLAGCFTWTTKQSPLLTDTADLPAYQAYLHCVRAEVSRLDAASALKQKESFVSSVSHELRTPLHGVLGAVEFLEETDLDSFQRGLTDTIRFCGSNLHQTLSSVLSYARINEFERRLTKPLQKGSRESPWALLNKDLHTTVNTDEGPFVCTNLATLCEEIVEVTESGRSFGGSADIQTLVLTLNVAYRENWDFVAEPSALRRIMMNIIGNSLKYSKEGSVIVNLHTEDMEDENCKEGSVPKKLIVFTVKDTGIGMTSDYVQNHLFIPFTQENAAESQGVGLGMSIVKSLVSLLSGQISVTSEVGVGTEIVVTIPMEEGRPLELSEATRQLDYRVRELQSKELVVVLRGFAGAISSTLRFYLVVWFGAVVLDEELATKPENYTDILVLDEGLANDESKLRDLVDVYGNEAALLSVCTSRERSTKLSYVEENFHAWERVRRPLGPSKTSEALLSCVEKLPKSSADTKNRPKKAYSTSNPPPEKEEISSIPAIYDVNAAVLPVVNDAEYPELPPVPPAGVAPPVKPSEEPTPGGRKPSVLLVEDNAINLKLLHMFMVKYGIHDKQSAVNGRFAIKAVEKRVGGFDIIFMDMSMPDIDGFEATKAIRAIEEKAAQQHASKSASDKSLVNGHTHHRATIIALTGLAGAGHKQEAYKAGVDFFVTKPVKFNTLAEYLAQWEKGELVGDERGM